MLALQNGAPFCADTKNIGLEIINTFGYLCSAWQEMAFMDLAGKPNVLFHHNVLARIDVYDLKCPNTDTTMNWSELGVVSLYYNLTA